MYLYEELCIMKMDEFSNIELIFEKWGNEAFANPYSKFDNSQ